MAEVRPFAALRYDEDRAGPLEQLVAPPYDVISDEQRREYLDRSTYNVVHLTLPDSEEQAAREFASWREHGVLVEEPPAFWALEQEYVGPDGVARVRRGIVASLKAEPYERRVILPHESTKQEVREGRLRLVKAVGAQLEPIFLLYEGLPPVSPPEGEPDLAVEGAKLWRLAEVDAIVDAFAERQLLIADGHHRYQTTVEYSEQGGSPWLMVVLVSTTDPGLTIFPTHRMAQEFGLTQVRDDGDDPIAAVDTLPPDRAAAVVYTSGGTYIAEGNVGQLDTELVESMARGITYTPDARSAVGAVDDGRAAAAFLLRPSSVDQVFEVARRGEVMPLKSTYFYPKLLSGLLFHPL